MAPEVTLTQTCEIDYDVEAADVFSLGATLFGIYTGQLPFVTSSLECNHFI